MLGLGQVPVPFLFIECPLQSYQNLKKIQNGLDFYWCHHVCHTMGTDIVMLTLNQTLFQTGHFIVHSEFSPLPMTLMLTLMLSSKVTSEEESTFPGNLTPDSGMSTWGPPAANTSCLTTLLSLIDIWAGTALCPNLTSCPIFPVKGLTKILKNNSS